MERVTAAQVSDALYDYLTGSGSKYQNNWVAIPEFSTPRVKNGRLDMIAILTTYQAQEIRGFEIKVARSDFLKDIDTGKYSKYLNVCHSLYFVAPTGLIKKNELPKGCGLLTWNGTKFTSVQRAIKQDDPPELNWQTYTGMLMRQHGLNIDSLKEAERRTDKFFGIKKAMARHTGGIENLSKEELVAWASSRAGHYYSIEMRKSRESKLNEKAEKLVQFCLDLGLLKEPTMGTEYVFDELQKKLAHFARFNNHLQDVQSAADFINRVMRDWQNKTTVEVPVCIGGPGEKDE